MPPRQTGPPPIRRSTRLQSRTRPDQENLQDQDHDRPSQKGFENEATQDDSMDNQFSPAELIAEMAELRAEIARLKADKDAGQDETRTLRANTVDTTTTATSSSVFGGKAFRAQGLAAHRAFIPYNGPDGANPAYDRKEKTRNIDPPFFIGNKATFSTWIRKMGDKFEEDKPTFRNEQSRMRYLMSRLEGAAEQAIAPRYDSTTRPFSSVSEMIQVLAAAYHDPNESSYARGELHGLRYKPGRDDIHEFIAKFNGLATKSELPEHQWKANLWDRIPPFLDHRLLQDSRDEQITYEIFCNSVATAAFSNEKAFKQRQGDRLGEPRIRVSKKEQAIPNKSGRTKWANPQGNIKKTESLTEAEKKEHFRKGTCFICGKKGHLMADCPENNSKEVAKIEKRVEYVAGSSESENE